MVADKKKNLQKVNETEIKGNLSNIEPIIISVASELKFKNCYFEIRSIEKHRTEIFASFAVFIICNMNKVPVGVFTVQHLERNRSILRIPPENALNRWDGFSGMELIQIGLNGTKYDEYFNEFISKLEQRLIQYGLKLTKRKRVWEGFKIAVDLWDKLKP